LFLVYIYLLKRHSTDFDENFMLFSDISGEFIECIVWTTFENISSAYPIHYRCIAHFSRICSQSDDKACIYIMVLYFKFAYLFTDKDGFSTANSFIKKKTSHYYYEYIFVLKKSVNCGSTQIYSWRLNLVEISTSQVHV